MTNSRGRVVFYNQREKRDSSSSYMHHWEAKWKPGNTNHGHVKLRQQDSKLL